MNMSDDKTVLGKAFINACKALKLDDADVREMTGIEKTRIKEDGIDPDSEVGVVAKTVIEIYRKLYGLMGGHGMSHWMQTKNRHTGGIPAKQIKTLEGREIILEYLDTMR